MPWTNRSVRGITVPSSATSNDPRVFLGQGDPALNAIGQPAGMVLYWGNDEAYVLSVEASGPNRGQLHLYVYRNGMIQNQLLDVDYNETTGETSVIWDSSTLISGSYICRDLNMFTGTGAAVAVPASPAEVVVPGLTQNITVPDFGVLELDMNLSLQCAAGSTTAIFGRLYVNGVVQSPTAPAAPITTGVQMPLVQSYSVNVFGLGGTASVECRATKSNGLGTYNIAPTTSTLRYRVMETN